MAKDLYKRYAWLVETIRRRGRITRAELDERWIASGLGDGHPMSRRTFYNYRQGIRDNLSIEIGFDASTYEYYIVEQDTHQQSVSDWLLNSKAVSDVMAQAIEVSDRIFLEDVPSARNHLAGVIEALKKNSRLSFDYYNYARSRPTRGVVLEPYFIKIFKQRWYVVGRNVTEDRIKTYALDRMRELKHLKERFEMPATFNADEYFRYAFGIVVTKGEPQKIAIKADPRTAHYLRDLPLHPSQSEVVHDGFSIFYYTMLISQDLVQELLSYGQRLTVLQPAELRALITADLRASLTNYKN